MSIRAAQGSCLLGKAARLAFSAVHLFSVTVEAPSAYSSFQQHPLNGRHGRFLGGSAAVMQSCSLNVLSWLAGFLFIKAINAANKDHESQDNIDGY